jgi:hypothetical protein
MEVGMAQTLISSTLSGKAVYSDSAATKPFSQILVSIPRATSDF